MYVCMYVCMCICMCVCMIYLFKRVKILKVSDIHRELIITFIFRYVNATLPLPLLQLFDYQYDIHGHNTRHSKDLRPPKFNTDIMKRSFLYDGPELWLNLDESIKNAGTRNILKNRIRNKFLDEY